MCVFGTLDGWSIIEIVQSSNFDKEIENLLNSSALFIQSIERSVEKVAPSLKMQADFVAVVWKRGRVAKKRDCESICGVLREAPSNVSDLNEGKSGFHAGSRE